MLRGGSIYFPREKNLRPAMLPPVTYFGKLLGKQANPQCLKNSLVCLKLVTLNSHPANTVLAFKLFPARLFILSNRGRAIQLSSCVCPFLFLQQELIFKQARFEVCKGSYLVCRPSKIERFPVLILSDQLFPACAQLWFSLSCTYTQSIIR